MKYSTPYRDFLPPLKSTEYEALRASIQRDGVRDPVLVDEAGNVLDGHHRLSIDPNAPTRLVEGLSDGEKKALVFQVNMARRNIPPGSDLEYRERMKEVAAELKSEGQTQADIAAALGVERSTVSKWLDVSNVTNHNANHDCRVTVPKAEWPRVAQLAKQKPHAQVAADYGISRSRVTQIASKVAKKEEAKDRRQEIEVGNEKSFERLQDLLADGELFGTVYADPPWQYGNQGTRASTDNHYPTMTIDEIAELPIREVVADDAHLHLWTTNAFIWNCPRIIEAWGFEYRSMFIWCKPQMGIGNYWRVSHEILITAIRGDAKQFADKSMKSWGEFKRKKHSEKPEEVRKMIERASSGPYLELFARNPAPGWNCWGNQIESNLFRSEVA